MKTKTQRALMLVVCCIAANSQASLITSLYNTGVDANGVPLTTGTADPNYSLTFVPSGNSTATAITSAGGFPIGPWIADDTLSDWIKPNNGGLGQGYADTDPVGLYIFTTTFSLTGLNPATASITGQWATDNDGIEILLNNNPVSFVGAPNLGSWSSSFAVSSGFVSGLNTLTFEVDNVDNGLTYGNPTGLRVEMSGTASAVPEPSTILAGVSMLLPFGASTLRMLRKKQTA